MSIPKYMKYTNLCIPQMLLFFYSRFKYTNLGRFRSSYFSGNHQVFISKEHFHMLAAETCEGTSSQVQTSKD
ncbi:calmodulin-binding transcription activator 1 isoform X1 [Iris pallida]|uniref:Calmodulin-binding transcription activator 1 isoform X1 n=1 Tax=Iris pallida TaxID=29817 RepID=A0AAX6H068_IRIPA|nr:calmodulin-binding transcription activator 1 isoform X1 [Iris pallida]